MSVRIPTPKEGARELRNLPAPAKVNLFLHIVGRRADGYHLLQSAFALIDWCDSLHFELRPGAAVSRQDNSNNVLPQQDLCVRAAQSLQRAAGCTLGAHITLDKQLPTQAGLGGGSSDAATTLIALNRLWRLNLSRTQLQALAAELGADVPFFVFGRNAWVQGVGEQLQAVHLPPRQISVVKPAAGVSTAELFALEQLPRDTKPVTIADFAESRAGRSPYTFGRNDLQSAASAQCPEIQACIDWLQGKSLDARMTGSGSAVFAAHESAVDLSDAPAAWLVRQTCVMDAHPLVDW